MNQHKRTNQQTDTPTGAGGGLFDTLITYIIFALLLVFALWLISATPAYIIAILTAYRK